MSPVSNLYDKLRDNAKLDADYRARNEQATWAFNKQSAEAVFSEQAARLYVANLKQKYAFQDVTFRARRAAVSRQLAYIQAQEHSKKDSILNYGNRLFHIRKLFNLSAKQLVIRVLALSKGAKELYGVNNTVATLGLGDKGEMLDRVAEWLLDLQNRITRARREQKTSTFTVLLSKKIEDFSSKINAAPFDVMFKLTENDTLQASGLLMRGLAFECVGGSARPFQFKVTPPISVTGRISPTNDSLTPLVFGRVLPVSMSMEIRPQHVDATWNGNPYDAWQISCLDNLGQAGVSDIAMHLWLVHS